MQNFGHRRATSEFTLIELPFPLAMIGILTTSGVYALVNSLNTTRTNSFVETLAQDINLVWQDWQEMRNFGALLAAPLWAVV